MWNYNNTPLDNELCHYGVLGMKWGRRKTAPSTSSIKAAQKSAESEERKTDLAKKELKAQKEKLNKSNKEWGKSYDKIAAHPIANVLNTKKGQAYNKEFDSKSEQLRQDNYAYKKAKEKYKAAKKLSTTKVKDVKKMYEKEIADGQGLIGNLYDAYTGAGKQTASLYYEIAKTDPDFRNN